MQMQFSSVNKNIIFNLVAAIEITELEELLRLEKEDQDKASAADETKDLEQIMNEVYIYLN